MAFEGFKANSGPTIRPQSPPLFGNVRPEDSSSSPSAWSPSFSAGTMPSFSSKNSASEGTRRRFYDYDASHHDHTLQKSPPPPPPAKRGASSSLMSPVVSKSPPEGFPSEANQKSNLHHDVLNPGIRSSRNDTFFPQPKRPKPLSISPVNGDSSMSSYSMQEELKREAQIMSKRLARFSGELNHQVLDSESGPKITIEDKSNQAVPERRKSISKRYVEHPLETSRGNLEVEDETLCDRSSESDSAVVGLCPDMCPESERGERERKGDLDKYERLDGERHRTSKSIAVKKYSRTAERDAYLIRPLPVLQETFNYLLKLISRPYDDDFLSVYNFLWDRMRAIRMDLRMQHIFNEDGIKMHEQMIRLHIIAMHELCEYSKGEGFSEGFDAHLNIEQMNKASVELFQMYNDHRKKGIIFSTENEFRCYYALLKLDRHPGYKVEPVELSLDLANMTPEMRRTPEIMFARDVARACRSGNFIAFFRLAEKATYLQACLMHAHFAKLRRNALASLHSSLQIAQGIPVVQVVKWLGMEEENIETLLDYHGFTIKSYKAAYMVKEGLFLNGDEDFPTKCSQLVHKKKSARVFDDVVSPQTPAILVDNIVHPSFSYTSANGAHVGDKPVDYGSSDNRICSGHDIVDTNQNFRWQVGQESTSPKNKKDNVMTPQQLEVHRPMSPKINISPQLVHEGFLQSPKSVNGQAVECVDHVAYYSIDEQAPGVSSNSYVHHHSGEGSSSELGFPPATGLTLLDNGICLDNFQAPIDPMEDEDTENYLISKNSEAAQARLRMILRNWRRNARKRRELRELHRLMSEAVKNLLSLGPPILTNDLQPLPVPVLQIDNLMKDRVERLTNFLSPLNVSEVVFQILHQKSPNSRCICWKLIVCSPIENAEGDLPLEYTHSKWLEIKLMGNGKQAEEHLAFSSPTVSIWRKWGVAEHSRQEVCCLSILRKAVFEGVTSHQDNDTTTGASAIVFLVSENNQWDLDRIRLSNLLKSLPFGSRLPLLILSHDDSGAKYSSAIVADKLGMHLLDKTKLSSFSVITISDAGGNICNDVSLREGLCWLADQSHPQLVLHLIRTRELVLDYLHSSMEKVEGMKLKEDGPEQCRMAFNDALERAADAIVCAAESCLNGWPGPEIALLDQQGSEAAIANLHLPKVGWNSPARIQASLRCLMDCKLPEFSIDLLQLNQIRQLEDQKVLLEMCLKEYLTEKCGMMQGELANMEVASMVQRGATVQLDGFDYRIVPNWVVVFQRIYNWRLIKLASGTCSVACTLNLPAPHPRENSKTEQFFIQQPLLDEMIRLSSNIRAEKLIQYEGEGNSVSQSDNRMLVDESYDLLQIENDRHGTVFEQQVEGTEKGVENDRLHELLDRCNMLQNMIEEKLYVYF